MNKTMGLFIFAFGAAVGSMASWQYAKKYYEQRAEEEIASVKESYSKKEAVANSNPNQEPANEQEGDGERKIAKVLNNYEEKPDLSRYAEVLREKRYVSDNASGKLEQNRANRKSSSVLTTKFSVPYVISPEEFGEFEDYGQNSLTYYADHVLADENDDVIDNVDEIVGTESLTHFGEYEDDSVFVRNDRLQCDYEILIDTRTYAEVLKQRPHRREE